MSNRDWNPSVDNPAINSWYPCKHRDDYCKIVLQSRSTELMATLYKVVSMRGADIGFDLTLPMARVVIMTNTYRR